MSKAGGSEKLLGDIANRERLLDGSHDSIFSADHTDALTPSHWVTDSPANQNTASPSIGANPDVVSPSTGPQQEAPDIGANMSAKRPDNLEGSWLY